MFLAVARNKIDLVFEMYIIFSFRNMLFKIEDESFDGNEAVEKSKGNVSKAEGTIEAAQKEINVKNLSLI